MTATFTDAKQSCDMYDLLKVSSLYLHYEVRLVPCLKGCAECIGSAGGAGTAPMKTVRSACIVSIDIVILE